MEMEATVVKLWEKDDVGGATKEGTISRERGH